MKQLTTEKTTLGLRFDQGFLQSATEAAQELLKSPSTPWREAEEIPYWQKFFIDEKVTSKGLAEGQIRHYISTNALDRDREIMSPKGVDLKHYKKNPIVLWGHNYYEPENIVGKNLEIKKTDTGLLALTQFNLQEAKAAQVYRLYKGGWLKAFSVGFIPIKGHKPEEKELAKLGVGDVWYVHDKWGLLEYSTVSVPSNPDALTLSVAKELNLTEKMLEELEIVLKEVSEDNNDNNTVIVDLGDVKQEKEGKEKKEGKDSAKDKDQDPEPKPAGTGDVSPDTSPKSTEAILALTKEIEALKTAVEQKAGRELSTKNRALITDCVNAMAKATDALGTLLAATEPDEDGKDVVVNVQKELDLSGLLHKENINLEELGKSLCKSLDFSKLVTDSIKDKQ